MLQCCIATRALSRARGQINDIGTNAIVVLSR